jgi:hypothetical protein
MPQDDAQFPGDLNALWPLITEKQYTWPGHFHAIKRSIRQGFYGVSGEVRASHTEINLLSGKTSLFNAFPGTEIRKTYFQVPLTAGVTFSFDVPEAQLGDYIRIVPNATLPIWRTLMAKAAWVLERGKVAVFFYKIGTQDPVVDDTGYMDVLIVRPDL